LIFIKTSPSYSNKIFKEKYNNVITEEKKLAGYSKKRNIDQSDENKIKIKIESCSIE
ncbi:151_t:CDS:2, partial [Dentiscutata erythropus]